MLFRIDKFRVPALDIGKILKVKVKHDGSGKSPSWYLNKVENNDFYLMTFIDTRLSPLPTSSFIEYKDLLGLLNLCLFTYLHFVLHLKCE